LYDEAGNALQKLTTPISINAKTIDTCKQTLTLTLCKLWAPATPVRYYAYTRLLNGTAAADDYVTPFGIRELKYSATTGFTINGNGISYKLKGACVHSALAPCGAATPDEMWERTIKELLASGCTSIRTAHNPMAPEFYDYCDQLGMMVMDEWCDKWDTTNGGSHYADFLQVWQKDLTSFLERDRNHPSVVIWSLGNEVIATGTIVPFITDRLKMLVPFAKNIDKTRPYTHACVAGWSDAAGFANMGKIEDVVGVNYQDFLYPSIHSSNPAAVICGTEQDPYALPGSNVPTWFSSRDNIYVVGHHLWTGVDYLGESGGLGATSGFLDNCIFRKSWFYYQQAQWLSAPMVHATVGDGTGNGRAMPSLSENWNQTGPVTVTTFTNCETVDLYVNSTKVGTKKLSDFSKNMVMLWTNVPWSSGVIKAVGMNGGVQAAVDSIKTAGAAAKIVLKPDHTALYADGEDAASIEVDIADADNNLVITAANQVSFAMTGPGRSLGIASGNWTSAEPFKATSRQTFHGKALIVIQSTTTPGTINLTVNSGTLTPATLTLTTSSQPMTGINADAPLWNIFNEKASAIACSRNPGNKNIRIGYRVDVPGKVNLSVVSSSGRMVKNLTNSFHKAGEYSTEWNAMSGSGVYFLVLKMNNDEMVRKTFMAQ
jgi:beta-galactosidase